MNGTDQLAGLFDETPALVAVCEQPASRIEKFGPSAVSDAELVAMILQGAMRAEVALDTARLIICEAGSIAGLASWTAEDFERYGVGRIKGLQLFALPEIARRFAERPAESTILNRADLAAAFMMPEVMGLEVEKFWVLSLNRKNRLLRKTVITSGTATAALTHPREVFREAIRRSAACVVCIHNHPSGDPAPSAPDLQVTRQLREAAKAVDIALLDHVIIGRASADPTGRGFFSFREAGML